MKYLKLNGETILGHAYKQDAEYNTPVKIDRLVNKDGNYKYKYVNDELVELSEAEINEHPVKIENEKAGKFDSIRSLILDRLALIEISNHSQVTQEYKDRAAARLQKVNQKLLNILG